MRQLAILLVAQKAEVPLGVKELTALLQIPKPSVTRAIDRLQYDQLVMRRISSKDRRQVTIHLSPKGAEYMQQIKGWMERRPNLATELALKDLAPLSAAASPKTRASQA